jgi:endonuclease I
MKNRLNLLITTAVSSFMVIGLFSAVIHNKEKDYSAVSASYTNGDGDTYYNGISDSLTGDDLLSALRALNKNKRKSTVGYSSMGTSPSGQFKYTDYDTSTVKYDSNGQPYGEKIISFYSGNSTTSFNREHVWPNSHGGNAVEADIHMPRPTIASENGSRGNSFYVEGKCSSTSGWDPAMESFGDETYRGDSARIIFYCMVAESKYTLLEADSHSTSNSNKDYMMGKLSDMIKWNINYPVMDREQRRNEGAEYLQGNRNPFIDHPEYACKIWGDANDKTRALCSNASYPTVSHTAGIREDDGSNIATSNTTAKTLRIGDSVHFLPFVDGEYNANVSWELNNTGVVSKEYYGRSSYTNGVTITGLSKGTSTLTLKYSYDDNGNTRYATATVALTVNDSGSSGGGNDDAEGVTDLQTATYTVSSTTSVSKTGTAPAGSTASYSQTYSTKGQITSGKKATLTLSNYDGYVITGITLNMKSNGSSGAGNFSAKAGSTSLASTSGSFNTWYNNTSYGTSYRDVKVDLTNNTHIVGDGEDVTLEITGTTNSLYINSYTIQYGTPTSGSVATYELSSISVSGMTQEYTVGDEFSFDGICTATYSDGNQETVEPDTVSTPDMSTVGDKTITVTYTEDGITKQTTYTITVSDAPTITSLVLTGNPAKTTYFDGESFVSTGLTIKAVYSNNAEEDVTDLVVWSPDPLMVGTTSVTGTYLNQTITVNGLTVNADSLSSIATAAQTTAYSVGEEFDYNGTCTATYLSGKKKTVTPVVDASGINMSVAGIYTINLSYTEGGITKSTSYQITVSEKPIAADGTYTANGDYVRITSTSDLTDGEYLIVYESGNVAFNGGLSTLDAVKNTISVSISNGTIAATATTNAATFTYDAANGSFVSKSGYYIGRNSYSNGLDTSTSYIASYSNGVSFSGDNALITSSGNCTLKYNKASDQSRFRFYKSGQESIQLYKKTISWGAAFLSMITCDNGVTPPSTTKWAQTKANYLSMTVTEQNKVKAATANVSGTNLEQAIARYVFIVNKYTDRTNYPDYLDKASNSNWVYFINNRVNSTPVIVVVASFLMISVVSFAFLKYKKKEQ